MNNLKEKVFTIVGKQGNREERIAYLEDVCTGGCISGNVGELIYYKDTLPFYRRYKNDINILLAEMIAESGLEASKLFGKKWDKNDPLALEQQNQNLLAWFGFEEEARILLEELQEEVKYGQIQI